MILIGFDFETHLIAPERLAPQPVCLSIAIPPEEDTLEDHGTWDLDLGTTGDETLHPVLYELLDCAQEDDVRLIAHNAAFDLAVAGYANEHLWRWIFTAVREGRVSDTKVREKMLNLAEFGEIDNIPAPSGEGVVKFHYSLSSLVKHYLGINIDSTKEGEDAWRLNYNALEDVPMDEWPDEAIDYAVEDSVYAVRVYLEQEKRRARLHHRLGSDPLASEGFRVFTDLCLFLMTCEGVRVDREKHDAMRKELAEALAEDNMPLLIQSGILRPAQPPRPYANGAQKHEPDCPGKPCDCPPMLTAGKKGSVNRKKLTAHVEALIEGDPEAFFVRYNEPTERNPEGTMKLDKEFMEGHAGLDPILAEYHGRQRLQKLVTTELPRMEWPRDSGIAARVVHPSFDFLKKTGRTSSYAGSLAPGFNCQQIDPRARGCFIARDGYYLYSVDISAMELCSLAQKCYNLFGYSKLRDAINAGYDVHAYLGSQLAYHLDGDFRESCAEKGASTEDEVYAAFDACKDHENEALRKFFKHYRTFAKPTGLGYPGGLGPKTFVGYARGTYKVHVTEDEAFELRDLWFRTYPEMRDYFAWIKDACRDPVYQGCYQYQTPFGLIRSNATFCKASNGAGLQAFSAEGALTGLCAVVEATYVPEMGSILYRDGDGERHRPLMFVHDEIIGEARIDVAHEVAHEVTKLFKSGLEVVCPDVTISAEPCLMQAWNKKAEPVYDYEGRLQLWTPKEA